MLAGDWTRNGIDGGCVEAAVASGQQAAAALIAVSAEARADGPSSTVIRRVRLTGHGARTAAVRTGSAVLLRAAHRPTPGPATVRPRVQAADRRRPSLRRAPSVSGDSDLRDDRRPALVASRSRQPGERVRAGGGDLGADDRTAPRRAPVCRRAPGHLHAVPVGRRSDRVRVRPRGVRVRQGARLDAAVGRSPRPARTRGCPSRPRRWPSMSMESSTIRRRPRWADAG